MAKYLIQGSYTAEGLHGLMKEGGSGRRTAVEKAIQAAGGKVEAFYFGFGQTDSYTIAELPDNVAATALSLAVNRAGAAQVRVTVLLTAEEVDRAVKKSIDYRAPGR